VSKQRFDVLDSWRGICAFLVMLFHADFATHFYSWAPIRHGHYGVAFFFVLSGFVIAHTNQDRLAQGGYVREFVAKRFARIYPLHLLTLLWLVGLELVKLTMSRHGASVAEAPFTGPWSLPALGANLLLVNGFGFLHAFTWNGPAWSISTEFYTYLLFAGLVVLAGRRLTAWAEIIVIATVAWMVGNRLSAHPVPLSGGEGLVACLLGFFAGACTFSLYRRLGPAPAWLEPLALAGVLAVFAFGAPAGLEVFVFAPFVYVFAGGKGALSRAFRAPPLLTLGALSYSIYLLHIPLFTTLNAAFRVIQSKTHHLMFGVTVQDHLLLSAGGPWAMDALVLALILAVLALAALCHRFFERPAEQWVRAKLIGTGGRKIPSPAAELAE
jgi:peptidoglycan/LPS O-acetylase OafA/YrhL